MGVTKERVRQIEARALQQAPLWQLTEDRIELPDVRPASSTDDWNRLLVDRLTPGGPRSTRVAPPKSSNMAQAFAIFPPLARRSVCRTSALR